MYGGNVGPRGTLSVRRIEAVPMPGAGLLGVLISLWHGLPRIGLPREVLVWRIRNLPNLWRGAWRCFLASVLRVPFIYGRLHLRLVRADGTIADYGVASLRVVTTAGWRFRCAVAVWHGHRFGCCVSSAKSLVNSGQFSRLNFPDKNE